MRGKWKGVLIIDAEEIKQLKRLIQLHLNILECDSNV